MSLESQVAALVSAANSLTSQVAGKISEIDTAVKNAVDSVPQAILDSMASNFFIHQVNGDDSNPGTASAPLATLKEVSNRTPAGAAVSVYLLSDYTVPERESSEFYGNQLTIRPSVNYEGTGRPTITVSPYISDNGNVVAEVIKSYRNALINIFQVDIHIPYIPQMDSAGVTEFSSIFSTHLVTDMPTPLSLRLGRCGITVEEPEINPVRLTTATGMLMLSTYAVTAPAAWVNAGRVFYSGSALANTISARVIHDGSSLIPAN